MARIPYIPWLGASRLGGPLHPVGYAFGVALAKRPLNRLCESLALNFLAILRRGARFADTVKQVFLESAASSGPSGCVFSCSTPCPGWPAIPASGYCASQAAARALRWDCFQVRVHARLEGDAERTHGSLAGRPAQSPRRLERRADAGVAANRIAEGFAMFDHPLDGGYGQTCRINSSMRSAMRCAGSRSCPMVQSAA